MGQAFKKPLLIEFISENVGQDEIEALLVTERRVFILSHFQKKKHMAE